MSNGLDVQLLDDYFQHIQNCKKEIKEKIQELKQPNNSLNSGISFFNSLLTVIIIAKFGLLPGYPNMRLCVFFFKIFFYNFAHFFLFIIILHLLRV